MGGGSSTRRREVEVFSVSTFPVINNNRIAPSTHDEFLGPLPVSN